MRGVMDELAMTNEHAGVRDVVGRAAKEEEISRPQMLAIHRNYTTPCGLQVCVAGHIDAPAAHQHLGESGSNRSPGSSVHPKDLSRPGSACQAQWIPRWSGAVYSHSRLHPEPMLSARPRAAPPTSRHRRPRLPSQLRDAFQTEHSAGDGARSRRFRDIDSQVDY